MQLVNKKTKVEPVARRWFCWEPSEAEDLISRLLLICVGSVLEIVVAFWEIIWKYTAEKSHQQQIKERENCEQRMLADALFWPDNCRNAGVSTVRPPLCPFCFCGEKMQWLFIMIIMTIQTSLFICWLCWIFQCVTSDAADANAADADAATCDRLLCNPTTRKLNSQKSGSVQEASEIPPTFTTPASEPGWWDDDNKGSYHSSMGQCAKGPKEGPQILNCISYFLGTTGADTCDYYCSACWPCWHFLCFPVTSSFSLG